MRTSILTVFLVSLPWQGVVALDEWLPGSLSVAFEPAEPGTAWVLASEKDATGNWIPLPGTETAGGAVLADIVPGDYAILARVGDAWQLPDPVEIHVAPGAAASRTIGLRPVPAYATIEEIPDQTVRHRDVLRFQLGESATIDFEPHPGVARSIELTGGTAFSYAPSELEREQFPVTFRASGRERTILITPLSLISGEATVIQFKGDFPFPESAESKAYITLSDELSAANVSFNHESQKVRTVRVAGVRLVIQKGHENGLYERLAYDDAHRDNDNIDSLELVADEVLIRQALHLPGADVTIRARALTFEDQSETASLSITPLKKPGTAATGARGIDAGTVDLQIAELHAPGSSTRILVAGGDGQEAAPGANAPGISPAPRAYSTFSRNSNAPVFPDGWQGKVTYLKVSEICIVTVTRREDGTTTCPRSGNAAKANGTPGQGGSGGFIRALFDVSAVADFRAGRAAANQPTRLGSAGDTPYGAIKATNSFNCVGNWGNWSGTSCGNVPGANQAATSAPAPAPSPGSQQLTVAAGDWIHYLSVRAVLQFAKDAYLNGYPEEARRWLSPHAVALESHAPQAEDAAAVGQVQSEVLTLLERINNNLDYFGYPAGWVPMLSFEVNFQLFQDEVAAAGDLIYLSHYLGLEATRAVNKAAALQRASAELSREFDRMQTDLATARGRLGDAKFQAETLDRNIRELGRDLKAREDRLRDDAKLTLGLKKALRIAGAVLPLIPVYQPALGLAGAGLTAASKFNEQDALSTAIDGTNLAQDFLASNMESFLDDFESETSSGDVDTPESDLAKRQQALQGFNAALVGVNTTLKEVQSWDSDLDREVKILAAEDSEHNDLVKQVRDLNARKRRFAEEIGVITQLAMRLMDGLNQTTLAFGSLKKAINDVNAKIDLEAFSYINDLGQRARHRLLEYQYYLVKAYQYRALRPYHEIDPRAFQIGKIFDHFAANFTDVIDPEAGAAILNPDVSPNLTDLYTNQLREVTSAMVAQLNSEPPEQTDTILVELDAEQLAKINRWDDSLGQNPDGDLRLNLVELGGLFDQKQENLRIFDLSIESFEAEPQAGGTDARVTLHITHSGESLVASKGEAYRFNHYRTLETPPLTWRSRFDPVQGTHTNPELSAASNSLLETLLGGAPGGFSGDLLLYSRPSAWADLIFSKETLSDTSEMTITKLVLRLRFDFSQKQRRQAEVELSAVTTQGTELVPRLLVHTEDQNRRLDGNGTFKRVYRSGQTIRVEAPLVHGAYVFTHWVNRRGETISEQPLVELGLPASDPATVTSYRAVYTKIGDPNPNDPPPFSRGDANTDSRTDLSDAVAVLNFLFAGGSQLMCLKAGDVNDDGKLDISDPVRLLNYLFVGADVPPAPFRTCGVDPTVDSLTCGSFTPCP